jgi:transposase
MSYEEELAFLSPFFEKAAEGGILVVGEIKGELDRLLGRTTALASVYNLLHRHGWRKLAPDTRHPKADTEAQDEWKKNSPSSSPGSKGTGRKKDPYG